MDMSLEHALSLPSSTFVPKEGKSTHLELKCFTEARSFQKLAPTAHLEDLLLHRRAFEVQGPVLLLARVCDDIAYNFLQQRFPYNISTEPRRIDIRILQPRDKRTAG